MANFASDMDSRRTLTLFELNRLVRQTIELSLPNEYWVEAELSEVREVRGHCYMELVEKDRSGNTPVAKASAKCWANRWLSVRPHFERTTGQMLRPGMKVLLSVYPQFHEAYGFSWIVSDIDPTYTLGDMARKRREIIAQLKKDGTFELNRELPMPLFTQRIAVISSEGAAGYGDFCNQLQHNEYGFRFRVELFPAIMQGEQVEESVIAALDRIATRMDDFDCVVIIRGGGATSDMSGFDTLALAENVANFPLPVITGIGHDRDESVIDMVAHTKVKTPTAAAALLISQLKAISDAIEERHDRIVNIVTMRLDREKQRLGRLAERIPALFSVVRINNERRLERQWERLVSGAQQSINNQTHRIDLITNRISPSVERRIVSEKHRLEMLENRAKNLDPQLLLSRGYSITLHNGKAVRDARLLNPGDEIETRVENGIIKSTVRENITAAKKR